MAYDPNHTQPKLQKIITAGLLKLQESGYILPENDDHEVALAITTTAFNLSRQCETVLDAKQYIRLDGQFYSKEAIKKIKPIQR